MLLFRRKPEIVLLSFSKYGSLKVDLNVVSKSMTCLIAIVKFSAERTELFTFANFPEIFTCLFYGYERVNQLEMPTWKVRHSEYLLLIHSFTSVRRRKSH